LLAGIINGNYDGTNLATNTFGGTTSIQYVGTPAGAGQTAINANCIQFTLIPPDVAEQIDMKYDDGVDNRGSIRTSSVYGGTANLTLTWCL
jgi:hypothetical protein